MKTYRSVMFLAIFCCFCLIIVDAGWSAEQKTSAPSTQKTASPKVGSAKAEPVKTPLVEKNIAPQVVVFSPGQDETWVGDETHDIQWKTVAIPTVAKIKIEFIQSGGKIIPLADNLPGSGKYSWKITMDAFLRKTSTMHTKTGASMGSFEMPVKTQGKLKLTAFYEGKKAEGETSLTLAVPQSWMPNF